MTPDPSSKTNDFIELATQAGAQSGIKARFRTNAAHNSIQIVGIARQKDARVDFDRFLIEITSLADQNGFVLQLLLNNNDIEVKNGFGRFGFEVVEDAYKLRMMRPVGTTIQHSEMEFEEQFKECMNFREYFYLIERKRRY